MRKREPLLDWQVEDEDATRRTVPPPDAAPSATGYRYAKLWWWIAGASAFLIIGVSIWLWHTAQAGVTQIEGDLHSTAQLEVAAVNPGQSAGSASPSADAIDTVWQRQFAREQSSLHAAFAATDPNAVPSVDLHVITLSGNLAAANVVIRTAHSTQAYRQTRFYRHTVDGWQRTAPVAELWGPSHTLETRYFVFTYRQQDAQAVRTVAERIDTLYTTLSSDLGLPLPASSNKMKVEVSMTRVPGILPFRWQAEDAVFVSSPALYLAPAELADGDLLLQSLALFLLDHIQDEAIQYYTIDGPWQPLLDGLHVWQLWYSDLPLSMWHEEVANWVYSDVSITQHGGPRVLPEHYTEFCNLYRLWMTVPRELGIPWQCNELDQTKSHLTWLFLSEPPRYLAQLAVPAALAGESSPEKEVDTLQYHWQVIALATLVDYAVGSYGRERLPMLVAGLGQYSTWDTLIPAVYGVSAAEFEVGWQAYLVNQDSSGHHGR